MENSHNINEIPPLVANSSLGMRQISLALFLTKGNSLATWDAAGMLDREVAYYRHITQYMQRTFIFSYSQKDAREYDGVFGSHVTIMNKPFALPDFLYQFFLPFLHWKTIKQCHLLKTNQLYAAIPAMITKLFHPKAKLIVRCGYVASLNAKLYHYSVLSRAYTRIIEWFAFRLANLIFITSKKNEEYLAEHYPSTQKKIVVVRNAIDTNLFKPRPEKEIFSIGYVGRLERDKNLHMLLEAVVGINVSVCFVGQGPEQTRLERFAKENHIDLKMLPRVRNNDLPHIYNSFQLFIFPSLHEGSPKTLLEAMACGRPVIACNVIGVNNVITSGENGILVEPHAAELREEIQKLLQDTEERQRLGSAARKYVVQYYAIQDVVTKEIRLYQTLL